MLERAIIRQLQGGGKFIDKLRIYAKGGRGGDGLQHYGGIGGKGGDVYVVGSESANLRRLDELFPAKRFIAESGKNSKFVFLNY